MKIDPNDIKVNVDRQDSLEILEVKIEMPQAETRDTTTNETRQADTDKT